MAEGAGKDYLLKIGDGGGSEVFTTIGGLRSTQLSLSAEGIDVTSQDSSQWKTLLSGAGIKGVSVSGSGIFADSAAEAQMLTDCLAQTLRHFRIIDSGTGDYFQGAFKISSFERAGEYNGAQTWSIKLDSSGAITFTAA